MDVSLSGRVRNVAFVDSRASKPIELRKNKSQADPGWSSVIVERFPTTYSNLQLTVRLSKSSEDGLDSLLGTLASISAGAPGLQLSQTALGAVTATKQITDYLFQKQLLVERLTSTLQFPDTGSSLPAGVYVVLAADTAKEYEAYLADSTETNSGLSWNGGQLLWNGQPISKISYFVVRIDYMDRVYSNPLNSLSFSAAKSWASLYQRARQKILSLSRTEEIQRVTDEIRANLINAKTILDEDPDYTQNERDNIHESLWADTQKRLQNRIDAIPAPSIKVSKGTTTEIPSNRPQILLMKPDARGLTD